MKQTYWKIALVAVFVVLSQVWQAGAWDDCTDLAKEGPNLAREQGKCKKVGPNKMSKDGKMIQGLVQCRDASGKIIEESRFQKGIRNSLWFHDADGRKLSFAFNADEKVHGSAKAIGKNGNLLCELNYTNGKLNGPVREFYPDGKLRRSYNVIKDQREGKYLEYTNNGEVELERDYLHDIETVEKFYYTDGKVKEHTARTPDGKSFTTKNYWPNGRLQSEGSFEFKIKEGCNTNQAVPMGKAYKYAADGALLEEANYDDNGRFDGMHILIDEKGKRTESVYSKGKLTAKKIFSSDGKLELTEEYHEDGSPK